MVLFSLQEFHFILVLILCFGGYVAAVIRLVFVHIQLDFVEAFGIGIVLVNLKVGSCYFSVLYNQV